MVAKSRRVCGGHRANGTFKRQLVGAGLAVSRVGLVMK